MRTINAVFRGAIILAGIVVSLLTRNWLWFVGATVIVLIAYVFDNFRKDTPS